jgi:GNAT superfamily N-acetyltransferase
MTAGKVNQITVRAIRADEQHLLVLATHGNVNWSEERFTLDQVMQTPDFVHYFAPWPRSGDLGLVAENAHDTPIGVVWLRFFETTDPGYGFVDATLPELSIWVSPDWRGGGVGTVLISRILDQARVGNLAGVSLSVETGNPARALYERLGFAPAGSDFDPGTLVLRF